MKTLPLALHTTLPLLAFLSGASALADDTPAAALPSYQPGGGLTAESVDAIVEWTLQHYEVPGAAVAVVKDGEVLLAKGYGIRSVDTGEPVDAETLFQLASVSKTFTAAAFAAAVDAETLAWDQPARTVLPDFAMSVPYATEWVTGTDFLVHRSGFPGFFGDLFDHLGFTRADIRHRLRFVEPGYSFRDHPEYSNLGFFLAGEMVAEAAGTSFEEAVRASLLDPTGMADTATTAVLSSNKVSNAASPHAEEDGETVVVPHNQSQVFVAAGGYVSNAADMASYAQMLLNGGAVSGTAVLSEEALERLFEPVIASDVVFSEFPPIDEHSGFDYSPGWGVFHYNGLKVLEKGGALDGFRTILVLVPEKKFGIAVLANMNLTALPEAVRAGALQQMFGRAGEEDLQPAISARAEKIHELLFGSQTKPVADESLTDAQIDAFLGDYVNDLFGEWSVVRNEEDPSQLLLVCGPAEYVGQLTATDASTLTVQWPIVISTPEPLAFEMTGGGPATSFAYDGYVFRRLGTPE